MWFYAANYLDEPRSKIAWDRVHGVARQRDIRIGTRRMIWRNLFNIIILSAAVDPTEDEQRRLRSALYDGEEIEIPDALKDEVIGRSINRTRQMLASGTDRIESHEPNLGGVIAFPSEVVAHSLEQLCRQYPYFIEFYRSILPYTLYKRMSSMNGPDYLTSLRRMLDRAALYQFDASARAMHRSVSDGDQTWIEWPQDLWIEQDTAYEIYPGQLVKAIFVNVVPAQHGLEADIHNWRNITVVNPLGEHVMTMLYDFVEQNYNPTIDYKCPTGQCEDFEIDMGEGKAVSRDPCPACQEHANLLGQWLHTALRMIRRDFALSADPKPFKTGEQVTKQVVTVPRHKKKGKDKEKEKEVEKKRLYTIVSYEISLVEGQDWVAPRPDITDEEEKRQNWFSLHGKSHRLYEWRAIPEQRRHYRGPHWDRIRQKCRLQLPPDVTGIVTVEIDGVTYEVEIPPEGNDLTVIRAVTYPKGKYVPMLRPEYRKQPTIKKVTAKRYS